MNKFIASAAVAALLGASLHAQQADQAEGATFADADTDGNGFLSLAEVQAVNPDITAETMTANDLNADGQLSETEVEVWKARKSPEADAGAMTDDAMDEAGGMSDEQ